MSAPTVLVVDPDETSRERTVAALADVAGEIRERASGTAAATALETEGVEVIVTDADLGDESATELAAQVRSIDPDTAVIVYANADRLDRGSTADTDEETVLQYLARDTPESPELLASLVASTADGPAQAGYPVPPDEADRLAVLDQYAPDADGAVRAGLDRIVALAAARFEESGPETGVASESGVEAAVTLVEAHTTRALAGQTPATAREDAPAALAVVHGLVVAGDTDVDDRFADNELLRAAGGRAYMGAAIEIDGQPIGALEVYADEPRQFSAADETFLRDLAGLAGELLRVGGGSA